MSDHCATALARFGCTPHPELTQWSIAKRESLPQDARITGGEIVTRHLAQPVRTLIALPTQDHNLFEARQATGQQVEKALCITALDPEHVVWLLERSIPVCDGLAKADAFAAIDGEIDCAS